MCSQGISLTPFDISVNKKPPIKGGFYCADNIIKTPSKKVIDIAVQYDAIIKSCRSV
jgi:hypothetical protein